MSQDKTHDLYDFMQQVSEEIASEYDRIRKRSTEDPGTAGDQGEENWAELLRDWLPPTYQVVTKGRIISVDGSTSPQIDVLVLKPTYPSKLLNKKLYLAAGVAAAFECKTTLKASHIPATVEKCTKIKSLYPARTGSFNKELNWPLIYGLLAHSHDYKDQMDPVAVIGPRLSKAELKVDHKLREADLLHVSHPRLRLDVLCIADLASWASSANVYRQSQTATRAPKTGSSDIVICSAYFSSIGCGGLEHKYFPPIGALVTNLWRKLAIEDPSLQDLAIYYGIAGIAGVESGSPRVWPLSILSNEIRLRAEAGILPRTQWEE